MFRAAIKLGRINKGMHVSFNMVMHSDDPDPKKNRDVVNEFYFNGNKYINFIPVPYITIDLSTREMKRAGYDPGRSINLTSYHLFLVVKGLNKMIKKFHGVSGLYYYENNILSIDNSIATKLIETIQCGDKVIRLHPVVVPPDESETNGANSYEGIVFMINSYEYSTYLTITELEYLHHLLSSINMYGLSMQLMNAVRLHGQEVIKTINGFEPIVEPVEIRDNSHETSVFITPAQSALPQL